MTTTIRRLPREQLLAALRSALRSANQAIAELIQYMAEVDHRRLYLREAYPSMFAYCVGELGMSEDAAYKRIRVARLEELLAEKYPKPDARQLLRKLPNRRANGTRPRLVATNTQPPEAAGAAQEASPAGRSETRGSPEAAPPAARRHEVEALGKDRYKVQFTVDEATYQMLKELQDLLGHAVPEGDIGEISRRAYALLLQRTLRQKYGSPASATRGSKEKESSAEKAADPTEQQVADGAAKRTRYVPAATRRAVWERDEGQCTYVGRNGRRCEETRFIEMNHRRPFANGGGNTIANLELRCHAHNQMQAREDFGVSGADVSRWRAG